METEADLHALRAVRRASQQLFAGTPFTGHAATLGAVGAVIAMLAVHINERALYVRRGGSHPPAPVRAAGLLQQMSAQERESAENTLRMPMAATQAASTFGAGVRSFTPEMLGTAPIHTSLDPSYLRTIAVLDAAQCRGQDWDLYLFEEECRETDAAWVAEGARLAAEGNPAEALRQWGVEESRIGPLCDPTRALTFHSLYKDLRAGFTARGMESRRLLLCAVAGARLVGEPLSRSVDH